MMSQIAEFGYPFSIGVFGVWLRLARKRQKRGDEEEEEEEEEEDDRELPFVVCIHFQEGVCLKTNNHLMSVIRIKLSDFTVNLTSIGSVSASDRDSDIQRY